MKKFLFPLVIVLITVCGLLFYFFYRMGSNDAKALTDFPAAYDNYNQAMSDYSKAVLDSHSESALATAELERKTDVALVALNTKASVRISSLTKNDGELMTLWLEIADLAGKEFDTMKAYQSEAAEKSTGLDLLVKQFHDYTEQRQADYARYLELAASQNK